ncbi:hypothetical protein XENOCAPTIV_021094 [Xenoophorus captivus]|uniref:Secreted protein n=1 Tax=Xenoophorus captivus TaxID=1517983 RepID=A0ABV0RJM9_9TELE
MSHPLLIRTHTGVLLILNLYCHIFAARSSLSCSLCGAPPHPATTYATVIPLHCRPSSRSSSVLDWLPSAAPPPPITSKPSDTCTSVNFPVTKGVDRQGRPILYQGGRMICNNFNDLGCSISNCRLLRSCSFCSSAHARNSYPHNPTSQVD